MTAREAVTPVQVTGRRYQRKEKYTRQTMRRALWLGGIGAAAVLAYTIPFAGAAQEGYAQNKIKFEMQEISRENELLQTELARLKNPVVVEAYAAKAGMVKRDRAEFVTLTEKAKVSPKKKHLLARLSFLGFH